jgi:hypothetical protein
MEAAGTVDASTKPVVLFGPDTAQFGAVVGPYPASWRQQVAGKALHVIMEGCEPCSGLRWCRTYLLQRGRTAPSVDVSNDLIDEHATETGNAAVTGTVTGGGGGGGGNGSGVPRDVTASLWRLEALYAKLLIALRLVVKVAFAKHSDVLEAGQEVQVRTLDCVSVA